MQRDGGTRHLVGKGQRHLGTLSNFRQTNPVRRPSRVRHTGPMPARPRRPSLRRCGSSAERRLAAKDCFAVGTEISDNSRSCAPVRQVPAGLACFATCAAFLRNMLMSRTCHGFFGRDQGLEQVIHHQIDDIGPAAAARSKSGFRKTPADQLVSPHHGAIDGSVIAIPQCSPRATLAQN